ncbi:heme exporter protein CcmD [Microbulbifer thermotolerans]|nr:heme exporter protein CcmD [Microbulbifer thermotolerans]MCX2779640.1 heme exporter protein CcmD [Microbulbifer thermotolerans]MCX2782606.1 heme exporter protein CcmD [Microbulbifer thermotolerans]MCX2794618.1 heme exporter protein CcmD [Microbulbifer thermotolerans]MCX2804929.1 heme exporter protein CcmD [Microbulbifer thermotolerans]MCX2833886.1 heme exporter protein CcmD [Microbulbifer thermotolerans]
MENSMEFQFATLADFLAMGGHGSYVWASYAVTIAALLALAIYPALRRRQLRRELLRQQRIERRRQVKRTEIAEPA